MISASLVTVVVPVAASDGNWPQLLGTLRRHLPQSPVILCGPPPDDPRLCASRKQWTSISAITWLEDSGGRARQLNVGCRAAETPWIWCLRADSQLDATAIATVFAKAVETSPALYHLDLAFGADGPKLTRLNAWGANLYSRFLKMPFGEQTFLLPKYVWEKCGGYAEAMPHGEDHAFVWHARTLGIPVIRLDARVIMSARTYARIGWGRTTVQHFMRTWRQAFSLWRSPS